MREIGGLVGVPDTAPADNLLKHHDIRGGLGDHRRDPVEIDVAIQPGDAPAKGVSVNISLVVPAPELRERPADLVEGSRLLEPNAAGSQDQVRQIVPVALYAPAAWPSLGRQAIYPKQ